MENEIEEFMHYSHHMDVCNSIEELILDKYPLLGWAEVDYVDVSGRVEYLFDFENKLQYPEIEKDIIDLINKFKDVPEI